MCSKKSRIPRIAHHLSYFFRIDIIKAKLIIFAFLLSILVDIPSRLVPSMMISLAVVIIKFFLLFVIIVNQYVPMTYAASSVDLPANNPRRAISMDVTLSVPAILLHQRSLSVHSSVLLLLLHLINYLLLLLAQIRVVPCHYIKL
jgi:hypothetical protein